MTTLTYLFSFKGRINRAKLWAFYLVVLGVEAAFVALVAAIAALAPGFAYSSGDITDNVFVDCAAVGVGVFLEWAFLATTIKRLHDRDRRGWWLLVFYVLPLVPILLAFGAMDYFGIDPNTLLFNAAVVLLSLLAMGLQLWGFVELYVLAGTFGPNRFGPDPLATRRANIDAMQHG